MELEGHIFETGYLVAESRARRMQLSGDRFARQWIPESARERIKDLWEDFSREVYPHDDLEIALRNRYFLRSAEAFSPGQSPVFVSLGAGPDVLSLPDRRGNLLD